MNGNKEKTYLNWYNKIGYGSGDIAGNVVYALLSAFVMIFLTDTVGMNAGVVGTLIAVWVLIGVWAYFNLLRRKKADLPH